MSWGFDRGLVAANPCERGGRLYRGSRAENIWTAADEAAFLERAPAHLHLPLLLALWTGQRQGDLLRLPWSAYDGTHIRLRQSKTGARVVIPVARPSRPRSTHRRSARRSCSQQRRQAMDIRWLPRVVAQGMQAAGVVGVTFHDLRGTAVTRLALAGAPRPRSPPSPDISLRSVRAILDTHYLARDPALGESAIRKLERGTKSPN